MTDAEHALMQSIKDRWHAMIVTAVNEALLPASFVAALIANESRGKEDAVRFEPHVFSELAEVILGKRPHYKPQGIARPLDRTDLLDYIEQPDPGLLFPEQLARLAELATSRSLTQIMGWHAVEMNKPMPGLHWQPADYLNFTGELLAYFANRYSLDLSKDFPALFRCWNTGEPSGQTFDPHYVSNGLSRMDLYAQLG
jgi:hypothetical protein